MRGLFFAWALFVILGGNARAHDLWILPGQFRLESGEASRVFINNGDLFPESSTLTGQLRLSSVELLAPGDKVVISRFRVDGKSLTFDLPDLPEGQYALVLGTRARKVRLSPGDFTDYLEEEGLERALELRVELGEEDEAAVERYSKWAKTFVSVGGAAEGEGGLWREPVGHTLEIVPERDPNRLSRGEEFPFRVLYESEPLGGARVTGARAGGEPGELRVMTDEGGRAVVRLDDAGRWYLRVIHLIRAEGEPEVQWESFWSTLTFEVSDEEASP